MKALVRPVCAREKLYCTEDTAVAFSVLLAHVVLACAHSDRSVGYRSSDMS